MNTGFTAVYDISVILGTESIDYPGDASYRRELMTRLKEGESCKLSTLVMSAHAGTHLDAPAHFIPDGKTIDQYKPQDFIRLAHVIECDDSESIPPTALDNTELHEGEAILFKTENSRSGRCRNGSFTEGYVSLSPETAEVCVEKQVGLVGIDYVSIDRYGDTAFPAHHTLLGAGILVLEGLNLQTVPPGRYTLFCLPLKLHAGEASPVRAILAQ